VPNNRTWRSLLRAHSEAWRSLRRYCSSGEGESEPGAQEDCRPRYDERLDRGHCEEPHRGVTSLTLSEFDPHRPAWPRRDDLNPGDEPEPVTAADVDLSLGDLPEPERIIVRALDEAHDLESYYIAKADEAWLHAEDADSPKRREHFLRVEQEWAQKLDVVQAEIDDIEDNRYRLVANMTAHDLKAPDRAPAVGRLRSRERRASGARGGGSRRWSRGSPGRSSRRVEPGDDEPPPGRLAARRSWREAFDATREAWRVLRTHRPAARRESR